MPENVSVALEVPLSVSIMCFMSNDVSGFVFLFYSVALLRMTGRWPQPSRGSLYLL